LVASVLNLFDFSAHLDNMSEPTLFPSIGAIADQTDLLEDRPDTPTEPSTNANATGETEDKVVQEIESLCMKCHEQVPRRP
jgi:zinc finger protein